MHKFLEADKSLFGIINGRWHNSFLDWLMPYIRQSETWIPFYLFLLVFILLNLKKSGWFILFFLFTVALSDTLSSHIIKELVSRIRPCSDPELAGTIRFLVSYCPSSSSFTSSHAANHFAIAVFVSMALKNITGPRIYYLLLWGLLIAYAQVYVGVHFPLDIAGGALIGSLTGWMTGNLYLKKARILNFAKQ